MNDEKNIQSGFSGTLTKGKMPALLVVDFQRGFTEPAVSPLASECSDAVLATNKLIRAMRVFAKASFFPIAFASHGSWQAARAFPCLHPQANGKTQPRPFLAVLMPFAGAWLRKLLDGLLGSLRQNYTRRDFYNDR